MKTARYNYGFYPTPTQELELAKLCGCGRVVFNWGLESGFDALAREENVPNMTTLSGLLTKMKKTEQYAWLNEVSCISLQQTLRHLSRAWNNCWSKRAKRPRFKSRRDKQSAEFTRSAMKVNGHVVTLAKISGPLERDHAHKLSTQQIRENQAIAVETLAVKNMVKTRRLSRAISDVGWGMFMAMLEYKADWYNRTLLKLERFYPSSKTCSSCEHVVNSLPLAVRQWSCPQCGAIHDRDINAAINIKRAAGLVDLFNHACGEPTPGVQQRLLFAL